MRWLTFVILAVVATTLQVTVAPRLAFHGARLDCILILVVFYALYGPSEHAILAGWLGGALADVMTIERFGLLSLSYALTGALVVSIRDALFIRHPLTHFSVTLAGGVLVQAMWAAYRLIVGLPVGPLVPLLLACAGSAVVAVPAHRALLTLPGLLGFRVGKHSGAYSPGARGYLV